MSQPRIWISCVVAVTMSATGVSAQTVEAGASIATSCKGSDGSFCNDTHGGLRTFGPFAGVWFGDRIEVGGRVVWLKQPDLEGQFFAPPGPSVHTFISDRHRTIAQGEVIWHFRRGNRVRPMFGVGVGRFWDRQQVSCEPTGCESRLSVTGRTAGRVRESHGDESIVVGLSVLVDPRLRVRGGWRYHNPFRDELALSELFIGAGYQF